ncbi:MAG: aminoglycoside phosphotransferase family protein [Dermatophilaceae bacterium]
MTSLVPAAFAERVARLPPDPLDPSGTSSVSGSDWVRTLPRLLDEILLEWELAVDGAVRTGACSVAIPVRAAGGPAMLKVGWPHTEARPEHLALRRWGGHGAVRLLRADPSRFALLLERLDPDTDLHGTPAEQACAVIGDLLRVLRVPAPPQVPRLTAYADRVVEKLARAPAVLPRRFADQARQLGRDLGASDADSALLHTDLHFANVLTGRRSPWLAIDPKPMAGDPAFEVAPALVNRTAELAGVGSVRDSLIRRLEVICDYGGIDPDRARAWTIVREVDNAMGLGNDRGRISLAMTVVKAMNP